MRGESRYSGTHQKGVHQADTYCSASLQPVPHSFPKFLHCVFTIISTGQATQTTLWKSLHG